MSIVSLIVIAVIVLIVIIIVARNLKIVPQAHAFVIERLGAYHQTWGTGLHLKVPFIDTIRVFPKRTLFYDIPPSEVLTVDKKSMTVDSYILWKEVLPNALLPLITLFGLAFGSLLGGAAVVEIVFSWPGLGYTVVQAIIYRDFQTVQAIVLWIALMYMVINLVVDLSYVHLDPRLRKAGR